MKPYFYILTGNLLSLSNQPESRERKEGESGVGGLAILATGAFLPRVSVFLAGIKHFEIRLQLKEKRFKTFCLVSVDSYKFVEQEKYQ